MTIQSSAGVKIFIARPGLIPSSSPNEWEEIGEIVNYGEFGRVYQLISHDALNARGTRKLKGQYNDGQLNVQVGRDPQDAGQADAIAARDTDYSYWFKIELNDVPNGGSTPTTFTFEAMVMSYTTNIGGPNQIIGASMLIEIQSGTITETPAA